MSGKIIFITMIFGFMLNGCLRTTPTAVTITNKTLAKDKYPTRLYKVESTEKYDAYETGWAGEKARSMALNSSVLYADVLKAFKKGCGFSESDLVETRFVSYEPPVAYEVWVFKDSLSKKDDKTSGMSVILTSRSDIGGTDIRLIGQCHNSGGMHIVFAK